MSFTLSARSHERLIGVHPSLIEVVHRAAAHCPNTYSFVVTEGVRTLARQKKLFKAGLSQTLNSYHLTGHAVDLAVIVGRVAVWKLEAYEELNLLMQDSAKAIGVPLTWGGGWATFKDGPHWQTER